VGAAHLDALGERVEAEVRRRDPVRGVTDDQGAAAARSDLADPIAPTPALSTGQPDPG
jgi:hypothetical protein